MPSIDSKKTTCWLLDLIISYYNAVILLNLKNMTRLTSPCLMLDVQCMCFFRVNVCTAAILNSASVADFAAQWLTRCLSAQHIQLLCSMRFWGARGGEAPMHKLMCHADGSPCSCIMITSRGIVTHHRVKDRTHSSLFTRSQGLC